MGKVARSNIVIAVLAAMLLAGCARSPNVRKQMYVDSGNRYFQKQQYRDASIQYQNAIQIDPGNADAHYRLARTFLNLGYWSDAYRELTRTTELAPENLKAQIDLGTLQLAARQFQEAQNHADSVLQRDPNNVDAHILRANALAQLQDMDASLKEMQTAIGLNPQLSRSYLDLGVLQISAKQAVAAEESFKQAVSLDPKSLTARLALGGFYAQQQRWSLAEEQFRQAIQAEPKNVASHIALCSLFLAEKQNSAAEQAAKEAKQALKDSPEGYRLLGDLYTQVGDFQKALEEYASLYKEHPKDLRIKKNYIQLLLVQGRPDEAATLNDQILKANPKDDESQVVRSQILVRQGRAADAIDQLQGIIKREPDNAVAYYTLGLALDATGQSANAEAQLRQAVRLNPNLLEAQTALAAVALKKGDADDLKSAAEMIVSARPGAPEGYVYRALARGAKNDLAGAEADSSKAMEIAPQNPAGFAAMAQLRAAQKKYADAEKFYGQALTLNPNFTEALQGLVAVLLQEKQPDKALDKVNEVVSRAPQNEAYYVLQSNLLLSRKPPEFDKAEAALLKASELNKSDASPLLALAQLYTAKGSPDKAAARFEEAIQHNPKDARGYLMLGALYEQERNWQKAQDFYQKALQAQPNYPLAANNLAYLMLEHGGNSDVALTLAQTARQQLPDNHSVADTLAWAYYNKGAYKLAIDLLEEVIKKPPVEPSYYYHLGLAYQKIDEKAKAKTDLEHVLKMNPQYEHADTIHNALAELGRT